MNVFDAAQTDELVTVRDWLRFGISQFRAANLVYGHGTTNAVDEAAYLILATLNLPIDELEPWLDARLVSDERRAVCKILQERITSRKPASYLTGEAWIQGYRFAIDDRVIVPRSYIGELMFSNLPALVGRETPPTRILDMCTGSGCLAILAALVFPSATVDGVDVSDGALAVARANVADYGLKHRIKLIKSDIFSQVPAKSYDLIVANPPYVSEIAMADFPREYRAEPPLAHAGGKDGLDLVRRILSDAGRYLAPDGLLVVEVGQTADLLEADYPRLSFMWLDTEASEREVFALPASSLTGHSI